MLAFHFLFFMEIMLIISLVTSHPSSMKPHSRKLQQESYNDVSFQPINTDHYFNSASPPHLPPSHQLRYPNQPFDASMVLTVLVLLTALFFMGFFSMYIRRVSGEPAPEYSSSSRITPSPPSRAAFGLHSKGLDPEVIKSLPVYGYYYGEAKYQMECAICLGEFEEKEIVKMIPYCKHVFHLECIETWLKMHVTCPVCRGTQFFEMNTKSGGDFSSGGDLPDRVDEGASVQGGRSTAENGDTLIEVGAVSVVSISGSSSS